MPRTKGEGVSVEGGFTMSASSEIEGVREGQQPVASEGQLPCSLNGLFAGTSGAGLGAVFGFGGSVLNQITGSATSKAKTLGFWRSSWQEAGKSAKAFAVMSGVFALVSCVVERVRMKRDAVNGAIAGCATGLALGWEGGPTSALQNCVLIGGLSYAVDRYGGADAQAASSSSSTSIQQQGSSQNANFSFPEMATAAATAVFTPAAQWLRPLRCHPSGDAPYCTLLPRQIASRSPASGGTTSPRARRRRSSS